ncbi:ABC transporter permease [Microbacterium sp. NPDC090003]|uniref:ABC transporter permease n=1 Tax=Microbacterium sp. NPDC090003 TaxID=3364203 RepID=UPI00380B77D7
MTVPTTAAGAAPDGSPVASGMPETATLRTPASVPPERKTFWSQLAQAFAMFRNRKSIAGLIILGVFVLIAIFAEWIAPYGPTQKDRSALRQPPSFEHWLGTTHMGEDVLSQIIFGTRGVIVVGFLSAAIATVIAITIGVIAGYVRGWKSESLSALTNVFLVIPGIPLIIIIASQFDNPPLILIAAVLGLTGWAWGARVLRAQTMSLRNRDFIQAARANGEPLRRIITVEMLPNLMALIASSFVGTVTAAILGLTTLAFIGVIPVNNLNWGTILFWAQQNGAFPRLWWWYVPAGLCIAIIGVALSLINFGIDEYVNPRLRSAGERARAMKKKGLDVNDAVTAVRSIPMANTDAPPSSTRHDTTTQNSSNISTRNAK